jgi:hypothetical protein
VRVRLNRQVVARLSQNENITAVVEGFANYFEIEDVSGVFSRLGSFMIRRATLCLLVAGHKVGNPQASQAWHGSRHLLGVTSNAMRF